MDVSGGVLAKLDAGHPCRMTMICILMFCALKFSPFSALQAITRSGVGHWGFLSRK
jgi:hypothetical protein